MRFHCRYWRYRVHVLCRCSCVLVGMGHGCWWVCVSVDGKGKQGRRWMTASHVFGTCTCRLMEVLGEGRMDAEGR
jgi:hypothetical protein